jgi:hypothetical protein
VTDYIQFTTEDGATILVEAAKEETVQPGIVKAGLKEEAEKAVAKAQASFEQALEIVRYNATAFIKKVRGLSDPPDEVEMEFGLKATGEVGNFAVAKASAEASYTVKLTWKREAKASEKQVDVETKQA